MGKQEDNAINIAKINEIAKSAHKRVDKVEEQINEIREENKVIYELASNMKVMSEIQKVQNSDIEEIKQDVKSITAKPVKRYENVINQIITFFIGAILVIVANKIGLM